MVQERTIDGRMRTRASLPDETGPRARTGSQRGTIGQVRSRSRLPRRLDRPDQRLLVVRLAQQHRPIEQAAGPIADAVLAGREHQADPGLPFHRQTSQRDPVQPRQAEIGHQHVEAAPVQQLQRRFRAARLRDHVRLAGEQLGAGVADQRVVLYQQELQRTRPGARRLDIPVAGTGEPAAGTLARGQHLAQLPGQRLGRVRLG